MKTFLIQDKEISFDDNFCKANDIFSFFHIRSWDCFDMFLDELHSYSSLETVMENLFDLGAKQIVSCVHEAVRTIVKMGIMTYSKDDFLDEYYDNIFPIIIKPYEDIKERYNEILYDEEQKKLYKQYQRSSRGKWVGGGFGLSGAIDGAINAGILNTITGAFRFVGDTVVDLADGFGSMINKSNFKNSDIFNTYAHYVRIACESVGYALYDKLMDLGMIQAVQIDSKSVSSIISNIKNYSASKAEKIELLISCIHKNPYEYEIYELLFNLLGFNNLQVGEIACYFGFTYEVENNFYNSVVNKINNIINMPQDSPIECEQKYNALKRYLISIHVLDSNGAWDDKYIKTFGFKEEVERLKTILNTLQAKSIHVQGTTFSNVATAQNRYNQLKEEEEHRRAVEYAKEEAKEAAGKGIGCIIGIVVAIAIIWGCVKIAPIFFGILFEPSETTTSSTASTQQSSTESNVSSATSQDLPINPDEAEYFDNTCVVNYHRWFGGEVIKKDTGSFTNSGETYTRYIYSYDNAQYPQQYGELLVSDGCSRVESQTVTEDGEQLTKEIYAKEDSSGIFGTRKYTIHVHIYHDRNAILIIAPDKINF